MQICVLVRACVRAYEPRVLSCVCACVSVCVSECVRACVHTCACEFVGACESA